MSLLKPLILALLLIGMEVGYEQVGMGDSWDGAAVVGAGNSSPTSDLTLKALIRESVWRWFPEEAVNTALCIIEAESGGDPMARGSQNEVGLPQIHPIHAWAYPDAWPLAVAGDIEAQVAIMRDQFEGSRWRPWVAQKGRCW